MERDFLQFPDDENGNVLWNMRHDGDDLAKAREVDFSVIFPEEKDALRFANYLLREGQKVSFSRYDKPGFPWQVQAHPVIVPTHANVTAYERLLARDATELGGQNDGWGCFAQ
ncbi:ribonuclease E inhibitor RraB [Massilia sp. Dwa41.01b]|uniref:ribonuclease E inhibitor RraB n=1 Tax=unclassified Massilia TaxID=2609279 RepID=UPI00160341CF|nr:MULTISPECIES: ribonuclease E inhibitor RraB [unclassified Massilia]QNA87313.1 ribonuclease E inhibitor RraB [Massilia sp. Dwa41.01b]QNA98218.1 ribonuclease E inhibitor RraB [Massilia sp. Se16.2.3]